MKTKDWYKNMEDKIAKAKTIQDMEVLYEDNIFPYHHYYSPDISLERMESIMEAFYDKLYEIVYGKTSENYDSLLKGVEIYVELYKSINKRKHKESENKEEKINAEIDEILSKF